MIMGAYVQCVMEREEEVIKEIKNINMNFLTAFLFILSIIINFGCKNDVSIQPRNSDKKIEINDTKMKVDTKFINQTYFNNSDDNFGKVFQSFSFSENGKGTFVNRWSVYKKQHEDSGPFSWKISDGEIHISYYYHSSDGFKTEEKHDLVYNSNKNQFISISDNQKVFIPLLNNTSNYNGNEQATWKIEKQKLISFSNKDPFLVTISSSSNGEYDTKFKLSVYSQNSGLNEKKLLWDSDNVVGERFESLEILKTTKSAVVAGIFNLGGAHSLKNYFIIKIEESGRIIPIEILNQYGTVSTNKDEMTVTEELQKIVFRKKNDVIVQIQQTRDEMSSSVAEKAFFACIGNDVVMTQNTMNLGRGQTVSFAPKDDLSKSLFNSGMVSIYSDAWNGNLDICEANRIKSGNSYTFNEVGEFHFILCRQCDKINKPTLTVYVR
jgi:hypothetical protein